MDEFNAETPANNEGSIPNQPNSPPTDPFAELIALLSTPRNVRHRRAGMDRRGRTTRWGRTTRGAGRAGRRGGPGRAGGDVFSRLVQFIARTLRAERAGVRLLRRSIPRRPAQMSTVLITQSDVDNQLECSVCLKPYHFNKHAKQLGCGHLYHKHCIKRWLKDHDTCPLCRQSVVRL